ncbi:MAG: hypothetical protein U9O41_02650, partial [Candidatus Aerophobetes bacterium]|nr:hypothetical protein [Candidatus Aerophobetes bacterium]
VSINSAAQIEYELCLKVRVVSIYSFPHLRIYPVQRFVKVAPIRFLRGMFFGRHINSYTSRKGLCPIMGLLPKGVSI